MNIGEFLHSKRWKLMQNYIYSWGASVVLIGALFKLEHLAYASVFLGVGLSIEAIIFFVSAFEPLMEMPDWKAVYPQLRTGNESEHEIERLRIIDEKNKNFFGSGSGSGGGISIKDLPKEQIDNLKSSFDKLSEAAKNIKDITKVAVATDGLVENINDASSSIKNVAESNKKASTEIENSAGNIATSYNSAASSIDKTVGDMAASLNKTTAGFSDSTIKVVTNIENTGVNFATNVEKSSNELSTSYKEMTSSLSNGFKDLEKGAVSYVANLDKLNKNMSAINTSYELHLKGASKVDEVVNEYTKGVNEIGNLLNTSVEETKKFNQNTKEINENIQALNSIYGKMLGALNGK